MRYLIYTETFPSRRADDPRQTGIGRYCADLAWGLAELGHQVTVLTNASIGSGPAVPEPFGVEVLGAAPRSRREEAQRARAVLRRLRTIGPDYVLVGDPIAHGVLAAAGSAGAIPLCPILYGTELVAWGRGTGAAGSPRARLRRWRLRRYLASAAVPVCISRFTAGLLRQLLPAVRDECIVPPCVSGIFLTRPADAAAAAELRRTLAGDRPGSLLLTTVGRISERKNQLAVLEALDRLRHGGASPWHYLVVGNVDAPEHERYFAKLRAFAAARGLEGAVTYVHRTTDAQKVDYLDASDAAAMLSRTVGASVEGFGISAIEASARGRPVLVSDEGGMPETVLEGETGLAVPPRDIERVADALQALARDPARRAAMGLRGRQRALTEFTPAATAATLHAQLLDRRPSARAPRGVPIA